LIVAKSGVFGALGDCLVHSVFCKKEVIVIKGGGEVDWGSLFRCFLEEEFGFTVIIGGYVGTVTS